MASEIIIFQVVIVLALAVILGEIFEQFGLPSVAGELLSGVVLGPTLFHVVTTNPQIEALSSVALFFIIFHIGLELETEAMRQNLHRAALITLTGFVVPFALALIVALLILPSIGFTSDLALALALGVPSISIISVLVFQFNILGEDSGKIIIASTVIADLAAFIMIAAVSRSVANTLLIITFTAVFIVVFAALDYLLNYKPKVLQRHLRRIGSFLKREDIAYAILIIIGLAVAAIFQLIGISYIIGAFFAGLIIHDGLVGRQSFKTVSTTFTKMNRAFFIPLFFGFAGTEATLTSGNVVLLLIGLAAILAVSIPPSLGLTYFAAKRILNADATSAKDIAVIMCGRGAVGIVVATVALSTNIINQSEFSLVIFGTLIVSVLVPALLRGKKE